MAGFGFGRWPLLMGVVFVLAACEDGGQSGQNENGEPRPATAGGPVSGRDIEAPDVFEITDNALWDGRPSLGGVWIAHPDVTTPERVSIRNEENGREIVGALFRRERENPGPQLQLSSDAAEDLGILAGQPTRVRVVALRRQELEIPDPLPAEDAPDAAASEAPVAEVDTGSEEIAAAATAAIEAVETQDGAQPAEGEVVAAEPIPEEESPSSFGRRNRSSGSDEVQPVPEDAPPTSFGRRSQPAAAAAPAAAATAADISVAPLDGAAEPDVAASEQVIQPAAAPAPADSSPRAFVQAAVFTSEATANAAAEALRGEGLSVSVRRASSDGSTLWRVVVGPAADAAERTELLNRVRQLGYGDAYPVRG